MSDEKYVGAVLDREIASPSADAFGHRHFAALLEGLIESDRNRPPISIGLLGPWGSGKSSIKVLYENSLTDDASTGDHASARNRRFTPITFNAWRYGGEDIKRALLRSVYLRLGGSKAKLDDALFMHTQHEGLEKKGWKDLLFEVYDRWGWGLLLTLLLYLFVFAVVSVTTTAFAIEDEMILGAITVGSLGAPIFLLKMIFDSSRFRISRYSNITRIDAPRSSIEQYEDLLLEQLHKFKSGPGKSCERLVIFVDDLDRLSSEEMVSGLDAVRAFMEIPKSALPDGIGIVFVISCDEERLADALATRHGRSGDLPAAVFSQGDARRYLDRIFQFRVEIPPFPKRDMRSFARKKLIEGQPNLIEELAKKDTNIDTLVDRMIPIQVATPRNAIQIVNAFLQSWWIAGQREFDSAGSDRPGGLHAGSVTNNPIALGVLCALRVNFPEFYSELQKEPDLIHRFTDVFIRGIDVADQSESVQLSLKKYADPSNLASVAVKHSPLRQFIANVQAIRWPSAIRPLLDLSQDPITRRFGDKAFQLYASLVSGDHVGVLAELGRQHDTKLFSETDMGALTDMAEELERETDSRRNNALAVLAELSERYPDDLASRLLTPLTRRLTESPELRWRLGIRSIAKATAATQSDEQRSVACSLVQDLMKAEGAIDFRLTSGERPSLQEALEMAKKGCEFILDVRRESEFPVPEENALMQWLLVRRVEVSEKEQTLPLADLEEWMQRHEDWLLPKLGGAYAEIVSNYLVSEQDEVWIEEDVIVRRMSRVLSDLWESGEESRSLFWKLVTEFASVSQEKIVLMASAFTSDHVDHPTALACTQLINAFAKRITEAIEEPDTKGLPVETQGAIFRNIASKRSADISQDADQALQSLIMASARADADGGLAVDLLEIFYRDHPSLASEIVNDWQGRLLKDLPDNCLAWLARKFEQLLTEEHRKQIIARLNTIHERDNVPAEEATRHESFIRSLTPNGLKTSEIQAHILELFAQISARHNNPNSYLYRVFPTVTQLLDAAPEDARDSMLHSLFASTNSNAEVFGWLHCEMSSHWPRNGAESSPYDPNTIFKDAETFARSQAATKFSYCTVKSMVRLIELGAVPSDRAGQIAEVACIVWPHHRKEMRGVLEAIGERPTTQSIIDFMDSVSPEDDEQLEELQHAWSFHAKNIDRVLRLEGAITVLGKAAKGLGEQPDLCLSMWIDAAETPEDQRSLLEMLLRSNEINDEQRKRAWLQVEARQGLGADFFLTIIPELAAMDDCPETLAEMLEFGPQISKLFISADERYSLGQALVRAFRMTSSKDAMGNMARWIKELDVDAVLKDLDAPSQDEIDALKPHFSKSPYWSSLVGR